MLSEASCLMLDGSGWGSIRREAPLLEHFAELLCVMRRAASAAHFYEAMKSRSDAYLEQKGLRRSDLPRAAYKVLTEER
jgi:hypothetical protein